MIHQLKCEAKYFEELCFGTKTFEVRKNDRDFHVGDYLALNELTPLCNDDEKKETGRSALFHVHYLLDDPRFVKEGYVIMGIEACDVDIIGISYEPTILKAGEQE